MKKTQILSQLSEYGMPGVLILLCGWFSLATIQDHRPDGAAGADDVYEQIASDNPSSTDVLIVAGTNAAGETFCNRLQTRLNAAGFHQVARVQGTPGDLRSHLAAADSAGKRYGVIAASQEFSHALRAMQGALPALASAHQIYPRSFRWPTFLLRDNLINVANQIVVFAIIAIGMTMVIITAGIDLSVGSLVALAAVVASWFIAGNGGTEASVLSMISGSLLAILVCGAIGALSGLFVTRFDIPPFITTLGWMLVASGLAYLIAGGESIYAIPDGYIWLGRGTAFAGIPNAVVLMLILYIAAHFLMSRTILGRYIYAVGGNPEAARLSGVKVSHVLIFVYTISGIMAGLGGVVVASQLKSGAPTYGLLYELYVIAAVVVGGTSLAGGEGRIFGTFIGALIIGVIQNGMNLTGVESYTQKVVLGLVILGAVLLDKLRRR